MLKPYKFSLFEIHNSIKDLQDSTVQKAYNQFESSSSARSLGTLSRRRSVPLSQHIMIIRPLFRPARSEGFTSESCRVLPHLAPSKGHSVLTPEPRVPPLPSDRHVFSQDSAYLAQMWTSSSLININDHVFRLQ